MKHGKNLFFLLFIKFDSCVHCEVTSYAAWKIVNMYKPTSGRKVQSSVWRYFDYEPSLQKSRCKECGSLLKGKNTTNLLTHLRSKHKNIAQELDKTELDRKMKADSGTQQLLQVQVL